MKNLFLYTLYTKIFHNKVEKILTHIINKIIINKNSKIIIIDIGAFRGEFSKKIFFILKNMQFLNFNFFLVDPNPNFIKYLTSNNVQFRYDCENVAIGSERVGGRDRLNNLLPFYINNKFEGSGSSLNSLFAKNKYYNFSRKIFFLTFKPLYRLIKVSQLTLAQFLKLKKINKFTLLKIDAEGSELDILKNAGKNLKYGKIIYLEISALKNKFDSKEKKIANLLYKEGYVKYKSFRIIEGSIFTNLKLCDSIFVKEKYLKLLNSSL